MSTPLPNEGGFFVQLTTGSPQQSIVVQLAPPVQQPSLLVMADAPPNRDGSGAPSGAGAPQYAPPHHQQQQQQQQQQALQPFHAVVHHQHQQRQQPHHSAPQHPHHQYHQHQFHQHQQPPYQQPPQAGIAPPGLGVHIPMPAHPPGGVLPSGYWPPGTYHHHQAAQTPPTAFNPQPVFFDPALMQVQVNPQLFASTTSASGGYSPHWQQQRQTASPQMHHLFHKTISVVTQASPLPGPAPVDAQEDPDAAAAPPGPHQQQQGFGGRRGRGLPGGGIQIALPVGPVDTRLRAALTTWDVTLDDLPTDVVIPARVDGYMLPRQVHVDGVPFDWDSSQLHALFSKFGTVDAVWTARDDFRRKHEGSEMAPTKSGKMHAHVYYVDGHSAIRAILGLHREEPLASLDILDPKKRMNCKYCDPQRPQNKPPGDDSNTRAAAVPSHAFTPSRPSRTQRYVGTSATTSQANRGRRGGGRGHRPPRGRGGALLDAPHRQAAEAEPHYENRSKDQSHQHQQQPQQLQPQPQQLQQQPSFALPAVQTTWDEVASKPDRSPEASTTRSLSSSQPSPIV